MSLSVSSSTYQVQPPHFQAAAATTTVLQDDRISSLELTELLLLPELSCDVIKEIIFPLEKLLRRLVEKCREHAIAFKGMEVVGGFVRWYIMNHRMGNPNYLYPPDVDIRFHVPGASYDQLLQLVEYVVDFVAETGWDNPEDCHKSAVRQRFFHRPVLPIKDGKTFYCPIRFGKNSRGAAIEILFVSSLEREKLFEHDLKLPLSFEETTFQIEDRDALHYLTQRILRIKNPSSVDKRAWARLISFQCQDFHLEDESLPDTLLKRSIPEHITPGDVIERLTHCIATHFKDDPFAAIALTYQACLHLQGHMAAGDVQKVWDGMVPDTFGKRLLQSALPTRISPSFLMDLSRVPGEVAFYWLFMQFQRDPNVLPELLYHAAKVSNEISLPLIAKIDALPQESLHALVTALPGSGWILGLVASHDSAISQVATRLWNEGRRLFNAGDARRIVLALFEERVKSPHALVEAMQHFQVMVDCCDQPIIEAAFSTLVQAVHLVRNVTLYERLFTFAERLVVKSPIHLAGYCSLVKEMREDPRARKLLDALITANPQAISLLPPRDVLSYFVQIKCMDPALWRQFVRAIADVAFLEEVSVAMCALLQEKSISILQELLPRCAGSPQMLSLIDQYAPEYFDLKTIEAFQAKARICEIAPQRVTVYALMEAANHFTKANDENIVMHLKQAMRHVTHEMVELKELLKRLTCSRKPFMLFKADMLERFISQVSETPALLDEMIQLGYAEQVVALLQKYKALENSATWEKLGVQYLKSSGAQIGHFFDHYKVSEVSMQEAANCIARQFAANRSLATVQASIKRYLETHERYLYTLFEAINRCPVGRKDIQPILEMLLKKLFASKFTDKVSLLFTLIFHDMQIRDHLADRHFYVVADLFNEVSEVNDERVAEIEFFLTEVGDYVGGKQAKLTFEAPSFYLDTQEKKKAVSRRLLERLENTTGAPLIFSWRLMQGASEQKLLTHEAYVLSVERLLRKGRKKMAICDLLEVANMLQLQIFNKDITAYNQHVQKLSMIIEELLYNVTVCTEKHHEHYYPLCQTVLACYIQFSYLAHEKTAFGDYFNKAAYCTLLLSDVVGKWTEDHVIGFLTMLFSLHLPKKYRKSNDLRKCVADFTTRLNANAIAKSYPKTVKELEKIKKSFNN